MNKHMHITCVLEVRYSCSHTCKRESLNAHAAKVVMQIRLIPTADAIKGPSPCHQAKGNTTNIIKTPKRAPVIASFTTALIAPRDFNF